MSSNSNRPKRVPKPRLACSRSTLAPSSVTPPNQHFHDLVGATPHSQGEPYDNKTALDVAPSHHTIHPSFEGSNSEKKISSVETMPSSDRSPNLATTTTSLAFCKTRRCHVPNRHTVPHTSHIRRCKNVKETAWYYAAEIQRAAA